MLARRAHSRSRASLGGLRPPNHLTGSLGQLAFSRTYGTLSDARQACSLTFARFTRRTSSSEPPDWLARPTRLLKNRRHVVRRSPGVLTHVRALHSEDFVLRTT